jgi:flagellar biosynthesis protein FlhF
MDFGLDSPICSRYLELGKLDDSPELSEDAVSQRMAAELVVAPNAILADGGVFAFVGPTGVGKTTTVAKLAARYLLRHGAGKVALITTDFRRVGAFEQIRTFANILNVPLAQARSESELEAALDDFSDYPLVLIDTAGIGQRDVDLCQHFSPLTANRTRIRNYLVVASNAQAGAIDETAAAFRGASLEGCVITKLDEARRIGGVISMLIKTKIPVAFLSDGQRVPEDLHPADADVLISGGWALLEHRGMPDEDALALAFGDALANAHG